jgi:iron complex outermembrane recepter protein
MKSSLIIIFCLTAGFFAKAQKITGTLSDNNGAKLQGQTINVLKATDSSLVKIGVTNTAGFFEIPMAASGNYLLQVTSKAYNKIFTPVTVTESNTSDLGTIKLTAAIVNNDAIVVTSKAKPLIEVKADKTVLNIENSINAIGNDALELLRKSPGVIIDKDDNISLMAKNGVQVYVDGRQVPLSGQDLAQYLKSLQSTQIESIELITNPSAKYSAAGNAGIINIKLKKNKSLGTNGSANAGYGIGIHGKYNWGLNLNNRTKNANIFGSYNGSHSLNINNFYLDRVQLDTSFNQSTVFNTKSTDNNFKLGADFFINKENTVGFLVNGSAGSDNTLSTSNTPIVFIPTNNYVRLLSAGQTNDNNNRDININANYRYNAKNGKELSVDADYGIFLSESDQLQPNRYFNPVTGLETFRQVYNMLPNTKINIATLKSDYEQNFKKGRLGFGFKTSFINTKNDFDRFDVFTTGKKLDTLRSNDFDYKENINALYTNYNKQYKGFMVQVGLRLENTVAKGTSEGFTYTSTYVPFLSSFTRNYTNLFPSAAITFNKNPMSQWGFTYSRRIDRPAYKDLNPFEFKIDEYTFQKGNTELRPQYTNSFGVSHTFRYVLNTSLNYSKVTDVFTQLVDTAERSKSFITNKNLATQDVVNLSVSYPFQKKWYSLFVNLNTSYNHYRANFGAGRTVDLDAFNFNVYMQHGFKLGKGYNAELSGWYSGPGIWGGTFASKPMGSLDFGLLKSLWQGRANVKMSFTDMFFTARWRGISEFAGQRIDVRGNWESRQFKINFNYRFGSALIKAANQRKSASQDERNRLKGSGGLGGN